MTYAETRSSLKFHIVHPRSRTRTRCGHAVHRVLPGDTPISNRWMCQQCIKFQEINK